MNPRVYICDALIHSLGEVRQYPYMLLMAVWWRQAASLFNLHNKRISFPFSFLLDGICIGQTRTTGGGSVICRVINKAKVDFCRHMASVDRGGWLGLRRSRKLGLLSISGRTVELLTATITFGQAFIFSRPRLRKQGRILIYSRGVDQPHKVSALTIV